MTPIQYLILVVTAAAGGAVGMSAAGVWYVLHDFLTRVTWEDHADLSGKSWATARWTYDHTRWDKLPETAAYGAAIFGGAVAVLVPFLIGLSHIFLG